MRSTASLFNKTLFSKDIKRLWPIWVVFSIIASLIGFAYSTGIRNNLAYYYNHPAWVAIVGDGNFMKEK